MSQTPPPGLETSGPGIPPAQPNGYQQPPNYQQPPPYQPWNSANHRGRSNITAPFIIGLVLIIAGAYFLVRQFIPQLNLGLIWPVVVIGVGVFLIAVAFTRNRQ